MKRLCTICARGGSKSVPGKNIKPLLGKPLIAWTIEQARETGLFDLIAVSSDDPLILETARRAGADLLIQRPSNLASDLAPKVPTIEHAVRSAEQQTGIKFDTLVDLDATSPLRLPEDIVGAVKMLEDSIRPNIVTGCPSRRSPFFNMVETDDAGHVSLSKPGTAKRRQDVPPSFDMNASIYVWHRDAFLSDPQVFYPHTGIYVMPEERSHDIDNPLDFRIVEMILRDRIAAGSPKRFDLTGKVAVVTGATGILGKRFCSILAEHGARIAAIDLADVDDLAADLARGYGVEARGYRADISSPSECAAVVTQIEQDLGPIDILHNNAASKGPDLARFFDPVETFSPDIWRSIMQVNLDGYFFMAQAVGPRMAERGRGVIVQTCSIYGIVGPDQRIYEGSEYLGMPINTPAIYSASKAGVAGLTKYLATYWGPKGVRVNTLTPGGVESGQNEEFSKRYSARVPLGRMAKADDMAFALLYLVSDEAGYVTGQNLVVDGGLTAW